jgi:flavin reductase (DIM6/NTAB) family NADH-FMN oxidoreductase RutF
VEGHAELRELTRRTPSSVSVVSVDAGGQRLGVTVGTLVVLSLEPALVGVAVSRHAAMHELLRDAGAFAVSVLREGQEAVAQHFARGIPPIALWHGVELLDERAGPPLVAGALAWVEATVAGELAAGTHTFFAGDVDRVELGEPGRGLVRARGQWLAA